MSRKQKSNLEKGKQKEKNKKQRFFFSLFFLLEASLHMFSQKNRFSP